MSLETLCKEVLPLGTLSDLHQILDDIPQTCKVVLIGEASHGTQEFYQIRTEISKLLIRERGFNIVAVESDWPDAFHVNKFIQGTSNIPNQLESLKLYTRFPTWMWRNHVVSNFIEWLKEYNLKHQSSGTTSTQKYQSDTGEHDINKVQFFGLDVYSLQRSKEEVLSYLRAVDPDYCEIARRRYASSSKGDDNISYQYLRSRELIKEKQITDACLVAKEFAEMKDKFLKKNPDTFAYFNALQNAKIVCSADEYYSNMYSERKNTWNIRDSYMASCLQDIMSYKNEHSKDEAKVIVWAHNSHLGDARYTEMGTHNKELNLGQLVREHFPRNQNYNIGFTTHAGTVTASKSWNEDPHFMRLNPSNPDSYEYLYHQVVEEEGKRLPHRRCITLMNRLTSESKSFLSESRLERAVGVIYKPKSEFFSHYFKATLPKQFDCTIHVDRTAALVPLEMNINWVRQRMYIQKLEEEQVPETFPYGL